MCKVRLLQGKLYAWPHGSLWPFWYEIIQKKYKAFFIPKSRQSLTRILTLIGMSYESKKNTHLLAIAASVSNITHASDDAAKALCARLYVSIVHRPTYVLHRTECIWYTIGPQKSGPQVTY